MQKEAVRGSAPQEQSDWDSRPWVDPNRALEKKDTKALFIMLFSLARCSLELRVRHLIALDHRLYHQADEPEELKDLTKVSLNNFNA